jgi:hypothetical protein
METNPIKDRVFKLTGQWQQALVTHPDARVFCWMGEQVMDLKMIDAFCQYHLSDESTLADVFLNFSHPYPEAEGCHGFKLLEETQAMVRAWNEKLAAENNLPTIDWEPALVHRPGQDAQDFIHHLNGLAGVLQLEADEFLVVSIIPQVIHNIPAFGHWISGVINAGIDPRVRLMLYDMPGLDLLKKVKIRQPSLLQKLVPELDMYGALTQIVDQAASQQPDRAALDYKKSFLQLSQAVGKGQEKQAHQYLADCLAITGPKQWFHLEAAVYLLMQGLYVPKNQFKAAHGMVLKALTVADQAADSPESAAGMLQVQARCAQATLYLLEKDYRGAFAAYQSCLGLESFPGLDVFLQMELCRMTGFCSVQMGHKRQAWPYYEQAWKLVGALPTPVLQHPSLLLLAKDLFKLADSLNQEPMRWYHTFNDLFGKGWLTKAREPTSLLAAPA